MLTRIKNKLTIALKDLTVSDQRAIDPPPVGMFVKGINLGGEALVIEGNGWESYADALNQGLAVPHAYTLETWVQPISPHAPPNLRRMLNTVIFWRETVELTQALPNGTYDIYLWNIENYQTNWHSLAFRLNGQVVETAVQLTLGEWRRHGAYRIAITDGCLHVSVSTDNPELDSHLMGISIYKV